MTTQADESSWPTEAKTLLKTHMADVRRLLRRATRSSTEFRWYHPYDLGLNFNSARLSTPTERFSVYPQIELHYDESDTPKAKGDAKHANRKTVDDLGAVSADELDITDRKK